jgi:hypothetical protein
MRSFTKAVAAGTIGVGALLLADQASVTGPAAWIGTAEARVGRPLTPVSYAGVARRTTRRAVAVGAAASCVTTYNAYGQRITVC